MANLDRTLPHRRERYMDVNLNVAMNYGEMHPNLLARKFEETNMGPDEDMYNNYARMTLTDRTPDKNLRADEEPRSGVNRRSGAIQLRYEGHRGSADYAAPEQFLGFGGPEDRDPRGINLDPDFRRLREQEEARTRFVRFTPDDTANITSGGRSPGALMEDQQTLFRTVRNRLKVFDRELDGRRVGMLRQYVNRSVVGKQIWAQAYGDYIRDYAITPQRRANIICKKMLRDSKAWREGTADQDFEFARYTQICRRAQRAPGDEKRAKGALESDDMKWADADSSLNYKTMAMLMAAIVSGKQRAIENMQNDHLTPEDQKETAARKTKPFTDDLAVIMRSVVTDNKFTASDETIGGKTAKPGVLKHLTRMLRMDHSRPAHHYINAEIMFKSVQQTRDTRLATYGIVTDAKTADMQGETTKAAAKSAKQRLVTGAKLQRDNDADLTDSSKIHSYRSLARTSAQHGVRTDDGEHYAGESDNSQVRRPGAQKTRETMTTDVEHDANYGDNASKERLAAPMGSKYTSRLVRQEDRRDNFASSS